eukprot:scaffold5819_cov148-Skeletonema_menzelii.AAC.9
MTKASSTNGRQTNKSSFLTMRVLLLLTTTSCPIITTTTTNGMVSAWSGLPPPSRTSSRLSTPSYTSSIDISNIRHANKGWMTWNMANNPNNEEEEEERIPIAREGEWSAYMDENYNRIYYFNHESSNNGHII